jgi:uncharacterized lipoprotein YddW (UPF0748 family)
MSVLLALCAGLAPQGVPPPAPRELRAAWVATVDNIDWPSKKGLPVEQQKQELASIVATAARLHLNALLFQVRPECDALYPSELEPWSEYVSGQQGRAPEPAWDPLRALLDAAHARGIAVHAWINPFRARAGAAESKADPRHISQRHKDLVFAYGKDLWCEPSSPQVQAHALAVIKDLATRYDLDGLCVDDYFYPYPVKGQELPDAPLHERYRKTGGRLSIAAWRRDHVDRFVQAMAETVHKARPCAWVGISPFGIARPGLPPGIEAGIDQHEQLFADTRKWLAQGWCDLFMPQLYWPIAQRKQSYEVLLSWWVEQNPLGRLVAPANFTSKVGRAWKKDELLDQVAFTRVVKGASGNVHFSMKALLNDSGGIAKSLESGFYASLALPPAAAWLPAERPAAVKLVAAEPRAGELELRWEPVKGAALYEVWALQGARWELAELVPPGRCQAKVRATRGFVRAVGMNGVEGA